MYLVLYDAENTWEINEDTEIADSLLKSYPAFATVNEFKDIFPLAKYLAQDITESVIMYIFKNDNSKIDINIIYNSYEKYLIVSFIDDKNNIIAKLKFLVIHLDKEGYWPSSDGCSFYPLTTEDLKEFELIGID